MSVKRQAAIVIGAGVACLIAAGIFRGEQQRREKAVAKSKPGIATVEGVEVTTVSSPEYPPQPLQVRYGHQQLALTYAENLSTAYVAQGGQLILNRGMPAGPHFISAGWDAFRNDYGYQETSLWVDPGKELDTYFGSVPFEGPRPTWSQPSVVLATDVSGDAPDIWISATATWSDRSAVYVWGRGQHNWDLNYKTQIGGETTGVSAFAGQLVAVKNQVAIVYRTTSAEGTGLCLQWLTEPRPEPITIELRKEWAAIQPPHTVLAPSGDYGLIALRAEYDPRKDLGLTDREAELIAYRFSRDPAIPITETMLAKRSPGVFYERPVLAVTPSGSWYAASGVWGETEGTGQARLYDLAVMRSTDDGVTWATTTAPLSPQANVASAQPQLAATDSTLLLVFAWDANSATVSEAHRIQTVISSDGGDTWSDPMRLLIRDPNPNVTEWPMDVVINTEGEQQIATLLFQRQAPGAPIPNSIMVPPPETSLQVARWGIK